jgi:hypothetical protein
MKRHDRVPFMEMGLSHLVGSLAKVTRDSFNFNLGAMTLLILAVFAIPFVHLFLSTLRMKRAAETCLAGVSLMIYEELEVELLLWQASHRHHQFNQLL